MKETLQSCHACLVHVFGVHLCCLAPLHLNPHLYSTHRPNMVTAGHASWRSYTGQLFWTQTHRKPRVLPAWSPFPTRTRESVRRMLQTANPMSSRGGSSTCCPSAMGATGCCAPQTPITAWPAPSEPQAEPHHPVEPGQPQCPPNTKAEKAGQPCSHPALLRASSPALI